jgi:hypothetical protein
MDNPYATPKTPVADGAPDGRRPVLVWIITIYMLFGVVAGVVGSYLLFTGKLPMADPAQRAYLESFGAADFALSVITGGVYAAAAVYLFRLRKKALNLFIAHMILSLSTTAYHMLDPNYRAFMAGTGTVGAAVGWAVTLAVIFYVYRLRRRGILR